MNNFFRIKEYFFYRLRCTPRRSVHSPFVFDFNENVLHDPRQFYSFEEIEWVREDFLHSKEKIDVTDLGAGISGVSATQRSIRSIAKRSAKPKRLAQLLFRIADHYKSKNILELGTSLGISTHHLAAASKQSHVITLEGCENTAAIAQEYFDREYRKNISLRVGEFNETLAPALKELQRVDLAFIDGNHRFEPTIKYFETILPFTHNDSIFIFDDIYWSPEMMRAWKKISTDSRITLSIDLYFFGIVFLKKELSKENISLAT